MKRSALFLAAMVALSLSWQSCTQLEDSGTLQFGLELSDESDLKSAGMERQLTAALVSISGENGELIYDKEPLPLYRFGDSYTTKSLKLPVGGFMLTEFMLVDSIGEVIWATPKEGSRLAHLVRHPLPIVFRIQYDQTTTLDIQVIRVKDHPPGDFGYVDFHIGFVHRFCLKVDYPYRCIEPVYADGTLPEGEDFPIFQPRLTIHTGNRLLLNEPLNPGLNTYAVPMPFEWYLLTATDCRGKVIYRQRHHLDELLEHRCGDQFPPLVIHHMPDSGIIITPEGLIEPTIKQGVFGSITYPVDEAGNTVQPDIWPVKRDIYFYPYAILDSLYTFAPVDCYFPIEQFNVEPVAIVRTNSDGYFQVPLRAGEYLYLVKEGERYYYDAFISSHKPGHVTVYPEEVTKLVIHIIDCSMLM